MTVNYRDTYSIEDIKAKKLCFSAAMVLFTPVTVISATNAPMSRPITLAEIGEDMLFEIEEFSRGYEERLYVFERNGYAYIAVPSIYPTATSCLILRIDTSIGAFLRFAQEKSELFVFSPSIVSRPARMSKGLSEKLGDFLDFCNDITDAFMSLDRFNLVFDESEVINGYCKQIYKLAKLFAVPIKGVTVKNSDDGVAIKSNFSLFTAFCTTMLMLARNEASDRSVSVELRFFGGSVVADIFFTPSSETKITNESFLWEYLAADKRMLFETYNDNGNFHIAFQPHYTDWAYLEMKQKRNAEMIFNNDNNE